MLQALNQSSGTETKRGRQVADLTYGIIFLGTPHRGSAVASYGKMAFLLTKIFAGQSANTQLLRALEKNSETLDRVNSTFYETLKKYKSIHLFSFFEEKETRKVVFGMRIVPPECARIGDEDWGGIPENHRYMAKYRSDTDPGFKKVSNVVKRWVVGIEEDDKSKSDDAFRNARLTRSFQDLYLRDYKGTRCLILMIQIKGVETNQQQIASIALTTLVQEQGYNKSPNSTRTASNGFLVTKLGFLVGSKTTRMNSVRCSGLRASQALGNQHSCGLPCRTLGQSILYPTALDIQWHTSFICEESPAYKRV